MIKGVAELLTALRPSNVDMRDAFFDELYEIATQDRNVLLLTDDMGAFSLEKFKKNIGSQYFNIGIAEQNIVTVAAGLALGGKIPFIYGISTFMTMRCFEQIRVDLCCMNLPVTIVGSGSGYTYGSDGPTHHATQDIAIMRALPEMTIYNPSDFVMTASLTRIAHKVPGPKYIRIEKGILPQIYNNRQDFSEGFEVLKSGRDLIIVSTGFMVHQALKVVDGLTEQSIDAGVIDLYRVKPVNIKSLLSALNPTKRIVTLEEHSAIGGIGSILSEILMDKGRVVPLKRVALPDRYCYEYGNRDWLLTYDGLDVPSVVKTVLGWLEHTAV